MNSILKRYWQQWRERGYLHLLFLLFSEGLTLAFIAFGVFLSVEILLPTFISDRLSLAKVFFLLLLGLAFLLALGRNLEIYFSPQAKQHWFFSGILLLWGILLLSLALFKFPLWSIPIIIVLLLGSAYFFWNYFLTD